MPSVEDRIRMLRMGRPGADPLTGIDLGPDMRALFGIQSPQPIGGTATQPIGGAQPMIGPNSNDPRIGALRGQPPTQPLGVTATPLRGVQQQPMPDQDQARIDALRRHGIVGQLMGLQPTQAAGQSLIGQAGRMEDLRSAARESARSYGLKEAMLKRQDRADAAAERRHRESMGLRRQEVGLYTDPVTGAQVPYPKYDIGATRAAAAQPQGSNQAIELPGFSGVPANTKPLSEAQSKNYLGTVGMAESLPIMERLTAKGYVPDMADTLAGGTDLKGIAGTVQDYIPRSAASPEGREFFNAGGKIIVSILRPESGGAVTEDEWTKYGPLWLPWRGDTPADVARKMASLRVRMDAMGTQSGILARYYSPPPLGGVAGTEAQQQDAPLGSRDNPIDLDM